MLGCLFFLLLLLYLKQTATQLLHSDCTTTSTGRTIEMLEISTPTGTYNFEVYCELNELDEKPWLVIFKRKQLMYEYGNSEDYEQGYNTLSGNYFVGLQRLYAIIKRQVYELAVHLTDANGAQHYLHYADFAIGNVTSNYSVSVSGEYLGSMRDVRLAEWVPWLVGPAVQIPRMIMAIRAVSHIKEQKANRNGMNRLRRAALRSAGK